MSQPNDAYTTTLQHHVIEIVGIAAAIADNSRGDSRAILTALDRMHSLHQYVDGPAAWGDLRKYMAANLEVALELLRG